MNSFLFCSVPFYEQNCILVINTSELTWTHPQELEYLLQYCFTFILREFSLEFITAIPRISGILYKKVLP